MSNVFNSIVSQKTYKYTRENINKLFPKENTVCLVIDTVEFRDSCKNIFLNKKLKRCMITGLAVMMIMEKRVLGAPELGELKPIYDSLLKYTNIVAYIAFLYKALETSVKGVLEENLQAKWKQIVGYIIGFALFKYIPKIFDAIYVMQ